MAVWITLVIVGVIGAGFVWKRTSSSARAIDAGEVSESWLREHRAEKQDRFAS